MRTVSPQKKFLSTNPDYDYPHNTAGNFTPPYTGYYYMRAVGGGGSGSFRTNLNECIGGGAGGGYEGEIFLQGGLVIPYSVGTGGVAVTFGNWGNNGTDTFFGNIVLGGGWGGINITDGGKGGHAGFCKGGVTELVGTRSGSSAQSSIVLFGGGSGMTQTNNDNYIFNAGGKYGFPKSQMNMFNNPPNNLRRGGCSIYGLPANNIWDTVSAAFGTGGDIYAENTAFAGAGGRIQIWRLQ